MKERFKIAKTHYDTAKELLHQNKPHNEIVLEFMNIFNTDWNISDKIIKAVRYEYKYIEII